MIEASPEEFLSEDFWKENIKQKEEIESTKKENEKGKIVSTDKTYTFTVTGEITLNAVYNDVSVAKKGLSGGAVAGIATGSTAVAGLGGFSVFWFAIKKKSFADLLSAIKTLFIKK